MRVSHCCWKNYFYLMRFSWESINSVKEISENINILRTIKKNVFITHFTRNSRFICFTFDIRPDFWWIILDRLLNLVKIQPISNLNLKFNKSIKSFKFIKAILLIKCFKQFKTSTLRFYIIDDFTKIPIWILMGQNTI